MTLYELNIFWEDNMKRIITAIVALAMILSVLYLTACAEKKDTQKNPDTPVEGDIWLDNIPF